jgi:hypothetical protein
MKKTPAKKALTEKTAPTEQDLKSANLQEQLGEDDGEQKDQAAD